MPKEDYSTGGRRQRRRRMENFQMNEISFVDNPAQQPALAAIIKSAGEEEALKQASVDELLDDELWDNEFAKQLPTPDEDEDRAAFITRFMANADALEQFPESADRREAAMSRYEASKAEKGGMDLVDMQTSSEEGHSHGISVHYGDGGISVVVHYAIGPDDEHKHDHQVVMQPDGTYAMTENMGHSHTIDQQRMQQIVMTLMTKSVDEVAKQGPSQEVRERLAQTGEALPDGSFPIRNRGDLRNAISAFGRTNEEDRGRVARHIRRRARALEAGDMLPEEGVLADLLKSLEREMDELEKAQAEVKRLTQVVKLNDAEKTHYNSLDASDAEKFLAKSASERAAELEEIAKADPVVYTDANGQEYRKSDDARLVEMAKKSDEDRKEMAKLRAQAEDDSITKRAEAYQFLKGDIGTRKALVKAVDGIEDEDVRKAVFETLQSANKTNEPLFKTVGHNGQPAVNGDTDKQDAEAELEKRANDLVASEGINYYDAYDQAAKADPALAKRAIG